MTALFVTSFARDMYRTTGIHLVRSFLASGTEGRMLLCHDDCLPNDVSARARPLLCYNLNESTLLKTWLQENRDLIPEYLGGDAKACGCSNGHSPLDLEHTPGCVFTWFNRNASRWFRKIASLDHALSVDYGDAIIWVDSDCRFLMKVPDEALEKAFGDHAVFFLRGPKRAAIESGVIGFRRNAPGAALLRSVVDRYRSGRFREDERWDDGYQFQRAFAEHPSNLAIDIGVPSGDGDPAFASVLPNSLLGRFIVHFKGVHGSILRLMV